MEQAKELNLLAKNYKYSADVENSAEFKEIQPLLITAALRGKFEYTLYQDVSEQMVNYLKDNGYELSFGYDKVPGKDALISVIIRW